MKHTALHTVCILIALVFIASGLTKVGKDGLRQIVNDFLDVTDIKSDSVTNIQNGDVPSGYRLQFFDRPKPVLIDSPIRFKPAATDIHHNIVHDRKYAVFSGLPGMGGRISSGCQYRATLQPHAYRDHKAGKSNYF